MSNTKYLVLIAIVSFLMFQCGMVHAACTPGEKQTHVYKLANRMFYDEAKKKAEKFLWTDYECEKLFQEVYKKALVAAEKSCNKPS